MYEWIAGKNAKIDLRDFAKDFSGDSSNKYVYITDEVFSSYTIKVNNGIASKKTSRAGAIVTITANPPATGKVFSRWIVVSGEVTLKDASKESTSFVMGTKM